MAWPLWRIDAARAAPSGGRSSSRSYRQRGRSYEVGHHKVLVAVDDATWLAYVEVLADKQKPTVIGFLSRTVAWFNGQGVECRQVMSDNGLAYLSRSFAKACGPLGLKHIRTRPYTPNPTARPSGLSRPSARNGPTPWPLRTRKSGTVGCLASGRSITG